MSYREQIYRFFLQHGCMAQDAEDLTQQVCLRLCQAGFTPDDAPPAYGRRTCHIVLFDYLRQRYRERELFVPLDAVRDCPAPAQRLCDEEGVFLQECLQVLSGKQRQVVQMHFEEEMSFVEIAEVLGCTPRAVRSLYQRAINRLRKHFNVQDKRGGTS
ncbi:MAG: RNA polymerase sigma factor [Armatimonadota bacterium]